MLTNLKLSKILFLFLLSLILSCSYLEIKSKDITQAQVIAGKADDFVSRIGINGEWYSGLPEIKASELGIRSARIELKQIPHTASLLPHSFNEYGIKWSIITDPNQSLQENYLILKQNQTYIEQIEGANEPDHYDRNLCYDAYCNTPPNYSATRAFHNDLYDLVKKDSQLAAIPFTTPSLLYPEDIAGAKPIKHELTNLHYYPNSWWAEDTRPTIRVEEKNYTFDEAIDWMKTWSNNEKYKPIVLTEIGYNNNYDKKHISTKARAKYAPRVIAESWLRNIDKVYWFKLMRLKYEEENSVRHWGMVNPDGKTDISFNALKNMIDLLKEAKWNKLNKQWETPVFLPETLNYSIAGALNNTKHFILQKSNGDFYLLLWQDVNLFDTSGDQFLDINNSDDEIRIYIENKQLISARQYRYNDNFDLVETSVAVNNNNSFDLKVPDTVLFVKMITKP